MKTIAFAASLCCLLLCVVSVQRLLSPWRAAPAAGAAYPKAEWEQLWAEVKRVEWRAPAGRP